MTEKNDHPSNASAIPYALLRYTFVGYRADFESIRGCHCHPESSHQHAIFDIEKNLTRDQVIEKLARWNRDHPNEISHVLPTIIAEDKQYIQYNHEYFGDDVAFEESLLVKAEEYACDISQIESDAYDRSVVLVEEAKVAAEAAKRKAEDEKRSRAEVERQQVEKKERELLDKLKQKYEKQHE